MPLGTVGRAARENGLDRFVADALAENFPMLKVISDAGTVRVNATRTAICVQSSNSFSLKYFGHNPCHVCSGCFRRR